MKRKLYKQISTEWRSNLWLAVELLIISVMIWFIMDCLAVYMSLARQPIGLDCDNAYQVELRTIPENSPNYIEPGEEGESISEQTDRLVERLRKNPMVESAAYGSSSVYNFNFWGSMFTMADALPDSAELLSTMNRFAVEPEYPLVFNMKGIKGETAERLSRILKDGKIIVTSNLAYKGMEPKDLINRRMYFHDDSSKIYTIGAVVEPIKRGDYEIAWHATVLVPGRDRNILYVRCKPEYADDFDKLLPEAGMKDINYGNVYISNVISFKTIRDNLHHDDDAQMRNMYICITFLLVIVFLGIFGTFWFRTQQRTKELAIRMTSGATPRQIFARLIGEGLLILVAVTPAAVGTDAMLIHYDLAVCADVFPDSAWTRMLTEAVITFAALAVMIAAGILFPAIRAMKTEPARVLGGE